MKRLQRLRQNKILRDMLAETEFNMAQLIQPLFIVEGLKQDELIPGLRGVARQSTQSALATIEKDLESGVQQFILFYVPSEKRDQDVKFDATGSAIADEKRMLKATQTVYHDRRRASYLLLRWCRPSVRRRLPV